MNDMKYLISSFRVLVLICGTYWRNLANYVAMCTYGPGESGLWGYEAKKP